jgi:hypothetical protein
VSRFLRDAESILEIASAAPDDAGDAVIVVDRSGGMRMLDPAGWSMAGLVQEFGAKEVYRIDRRMGIIKVEAWSETEHCLVTHRKTGSRLTHLPWVVPTYEPTYVPTCQNPAGYARMLQILPRLAV